MTLLHRFVCLTDDPRGIDSRVETKPLPDDLPGWWNKISLFKPRIHDLRGALLYFDLDMVIIRNIDPLVCYPGKFLAIPAAAIKNEFAAALLRFNIGEHRRIWDLFEPRSAEVIRKVYGDQNWINACAGNADLAEYSRSVRLRWPEVTPRRPLIQPLPRNWFPDFKRHLGEVPAGLGRAARVIVFHGKPMVHERGWTARLWRGEASLPDPPRKAATARSRDEFDPA